VTGTPEIVKNSIVAIAFLQMAHGMYEERHVRSTMILYRVRPAIGNVLDIVANLLGLVLFAGIIVSSWRVTLVAWSTFEFEGEGALRVPTYPVRTIILLGSVLMCWQCLRQVIRRISALRCLLKAEAVQVLQKGESV